MDLHGLGPSQGTRACFENKGAREGVSSVGPAEDQTVPGDGGCGLEGLGEAAEDGVEVVGGGGVDLAEYETGVSDVV